MNETIIVRSKPYATIKTLIIFVIIGVVLALLAFLIGYPPESSTRKEEYEKLKSEYDERIEVYEEAQIKQANNEELSYYEDLALNYTSAKRFALAVFNTYEQDILKNYDSAQSYAASFLGPQLGICFAIVLAFSILGMIIFLILRNLCIIVTDKRIYAHTGPGTNISLPIYAVSSVATLWLKGLRIGSSSCRIVMFLVPNQKELYREINNFLMSQVGQVGAPMTPPPAPAAPAPAPAAPTAPVAPTVPSNPAQTPSSLPPAVAVKAAAFAAAQNSSEGTPAPVNRNAPAPAPAPTSAPASAPNGEGEFAIGKCTACGKTNVPVKTIQVNVAGRVRTRHLCEECAAKR